MQVECQIEFGDLLSQLLHRGEGEVCSLWSRVPLDKEMTQEQEDVRTQEYSQTVDSDTDSFITCGFHYHVKSN